MLQLLLVGSILVQDHPSRPMPSTILVAVDPATLRVEAGTEDRLPRPEQTIKLTSVEDGVAFDLNGDGVLEQVAWTAPGAQVAFLALDRNGNGQIDNGTELLGNRTQPGSPNGFEALSKFYPITGPIGWIDSDDEVYPKLLLWEDRNHNGLSEKDELRPASELYARIGLGYSLHDQKDGHGNQFKFRGWATWRTAPGRNPVANGKDNDQRQREIFDVLLLVQR